ncbi:retrovirus-related pol polyprotein from transposon TNT 1-94 [Tanacetum coccineum]|uniref:Retrovirus-related pol polyprotein from transposon TNT 1-94 n=1 Tax=Tanacetum coccineum TaxID=301880 RepID=A0ABQ5IFI7_9ASTR
MATTNYSRDNYAYKNLLIPLTKKTKENAYAFESGIKKEMFEYLEYVQSLEKDLDELQSDKKEFSNEYDLLLQECLINIDEYSEMACKYLEKIKECECLEIELSKQKDNVCKEGNDILTGTRGSDLYTITLQDLTSPTLIYFLAKASPTQAWLWHRRLSHLNFDTINLISKNDIVNGLPKLKFFKEQLCSSCEVGKEKRSSFKKIAITRSKKRLALLHMDLCGPMRVESINGKKYILVIVDDYSRYTWTYFLRSKDETPEVFKDFLKMIQRNLQAHVINVQTDRGTEFLYKTLHAYLEEEGIEH